jgi:hypothetical protein
MHIFQIYHDKFLIPSFVEKHIKNLNPTSEYRFINFEEGKEIIINNFNYDEPLKTKILYCLDHFPRYCHKSDLLRYCLLYIYGGVYIDVDLQPLISFSEMLTDNVDFFTSFGRSGNTYIVNNIQVSPITSNGILISKHKNNTIFLDLIQNMITNGNLFNTNPVYRGDNVEYLYNYLNEKCKKNKIIIQPFKPLNINDDNQTIYLVNHVLINHVISDCIVDKDKILIYANNPKYNFKRQTSMTI